MAEKTAVKVALRKEWHRVPTVLTRLIEHDDGVFAETAEVDGEEVQTPVQVIAPQTTASRSPGKRGPAVRDAVEAIAPTAPVPPAAPEQPPSAKSMPAPAPEEPPPIDDSDLPDDFGGFDLGETGETNDTSPTKVIKEDIL